MPANDYWGSPKASGLRIDSLRRIAIGGSEAPPSMVAKLREDFGVQVLHVWGMTETSPLATASTPVLGLNKLTAASRQETLLKQGRVLFGVDIKIVGDGGEEVPSNGHDFGDIWVRGPWIASGYYKGEGGDLLAQGWFPTGDVGTLDAYGYLKIKDRTKDVIKSGGEWISSIDLENAIVAHPSVSMAAVIGVHHPKWQERPLMIVVPAPGRQPQKTELIEFLSDKVAKWWLPDDIVIVDEIPLTATGKIKKKDLRETYKYHLSERSGSTDATARPVADGTEA